MLEGTRIMIDRKAQIAASLANRAAAGCAHDPVELAKGVPADWRSQSNTGALSLA